MANEAPVFVKIEDYKDVLDVLELIKGKLADVRRNLENINELKNEEDSELELWENALSDIEKKVENIDRALLEPESMW